MPAVHYMNADRGIKSWLFTLDHKRIALMYLVLTTLALFVGGVFAMILRMEHLSPGPTIMGPNTYNRMFTLHGVVMIFLFMIPAIPGIFGNFLLPLMLGAKDVAFPRLNLLSVYVYAVGAVLALYAMASGGIDAGWTFYAPYSLSTPATIAPALFGIFIIGFSSILTGLNFIVTIHTLRAPGMTWMRMPLFVWGTYATSIIQVLATPVIGLTAVLVMIERMFGFGFFDPARGGDPVLFQHLFWFYSHPAVYIMVLPSFAVMSEVVAVFSRKNVFGYHMVAYSSLGIAFVGFFAWGHHMFVSGQSTFDSGAFAIISMLVGVFTAIKVFNWVGTMYRGSIMVKTPFIYFCGFLYFVVFGGMTGIAVATASLDIHWHDTYFVVAHFHFIMVAAVVTGYLAALHYWLPKMFGRMYHEGWGIASA
ncbi:MAG TPA: cbb3-type cytochrome c oxidase subunit I, partial [Polyangia bacterium]